MDQQVENKTFVKILKNLKESDIWGSRYYGLLQFGMKLNEI